ncbi:hypothetical protein EDB86DRAFT_2831949 [Lactarius hatsudake]|nr:hypothetical protein EDB86DRAFT_2831949 [Lactarius hatsudake]
MSSRYGLRFSFILSWWLRFAATQGVVTRDDGVDTTRIDDVCPCSNETRYRLISGLGTFVLDDHCCHCHLLSILREVLGPMLSGVEHSQRHRDWFTPGGSRPPDPPPRGLSSPRPLREFNGQDDPLVIGKFLLFLSSIDAGAVGVRTVRPFYLVDSGGDHVARNKNS